MLTHDCRFLVCWVSEERVRLPVAVQANNCRLRSSAIARHSQVICYLSRKVTPPGNAEPNEEDLEPRAKWPWARKTTSAAAGEEQWNVFLCSMRASRNETGSQSSPDRTVGKKFYSKEQKKTRRFPLESLQASLSARTNRRAESKTISSRFQYLILARVGRLRQRLATDAES